MNLLQKLQATIHQALAPLTPDAARYAEMVKPAQDARFGDYQANCAMALGKALSKPPREVAQQLVQSLPLDDWLEQPEVAGPGFINLRIRKDWLADQLRQMERDERLGVARVAEPTTIVIDYSSPNVAKPMHVGHLRSTIIGDAIARLLRFLGHKVLADNHLGDWGTQMGMILWGWKNHRDEAAYHRDAVGELARLYKLAANMIKPAEEYEAGFRKVEALEDQGKSSEAAALFQRVFGEDPKKKVPPYPEMKRLIEQGKAVERAARDETAKLHAGDPENRALWQQFMPHCLAALQRMYDRLDIHFDVQLGESAYDPMLPGVVEDLVAKGLAVESEGALVVPTDKLPIPYMIRKRDGAFNYGTTDLATIKYRDEQFHAQVLLYVVDHRQSGHFTGLFDVARRWGYGRMVMEHIGFGTIMGPDKRPYKTREGDVVGLESLLNDAVEAARAVVDENSPDLSAEERSQIAEVVGLGAVKYADLCQNRTSDYVFDLQKMVGMEGNTATYMQYAYARNRNIFARGEVSPDDLRQNLPAVMLDAPEERALALQLLKLEEALQQAARDYLPSVITSYLWDLAKTYSTFYQNCPVLKAPTPELRASRLVLCDLTARVLRRCLDLLGIRTAERM